MLRQESLVSPPRRLSPRLLLLTILFVMISEVAIYVPSIANYRKSYLEARIEAANLATLVLRAQQRQMLGPELEMALLRQARVLGIQQLEPRSGFVIGQSIAADDSFDLRRGSPWSYIVEAFQALAAGGERIVEIYGVPQRAPGVLLRLTMDESLMYRDMRDYSARILQLSIIISLITAGLVYLSLQLLIVRPLGRITASIIAFRRRPEPPGSAPGKRRVRRDEIGLVESELRRMQEGLSRSLAQKNRLAALGTAVSKINHDLRSILSTVSLASERLVKVDDPVVRQIGPLLVGSVEKAVRLCTQTQDLARGDQVVPSANRFRLRELLEEVQAALQVKDPRRLAWTLEVPAELMVEADRERLYRVFLNLASNAAEAMEEGGSIVVRSMRSDKLLRVQVSDTGSGIPEDMRPRLFEPFSASGKVGGTGLGLVTARDLVRAHRGELSLVDSGATGTIFEVRLPQPGLS